MSGAAFSSGGNLPGVARTVRNLLRNPRKAAKIRHERAINPFHLRPEGAFGPGFGRASPHLLWKARSGDRSGSGNQSPRAGAGRSRASRDEQQKLAERESELAAREKALAAQESSFASLAATLAGEKTPAPAEASQQADADARRPLRHSRDSAVSGPVYPEQYGYVAPTQSYIPSPEPTYGSYDPYFFTPTVPLVTIISRSNRFRLLCRPSRGNPGRNHSGFPAGGVCRPTPRQPVIARTNPPPRVATRPTALPMTQQVISRSNSSRRPGAMLRPVSR